MWGHSLASFSSLKGDVYRPEIFSGDLKKEVYFNRNKSVSNEYTAVVLCVIHNKTKLFKGNESIRRTSKIQIYCLRIRALYQICVFAL